MNEGRFFVLEGTRDFSGDAEVGILVDGAGDETRDVGGGAENLGKRVGEGGGGLDRDKVPFTDIVAGGGEE